MVNNTQQWPIQWVWGLLTPPDHITLKVDVLPDVQGLTHHLQVHVKIDPYTLLVHTNTRHKVPRLGQRFTYSTAISNLAVAPTSPAQAVDIFKQAVRELSFLMREHDPRIGTILTSNAPSNNTSLMIPSCPLFDPPRIRPPAWRGGSGIDSVPCPYCSDDFDRGAPAMWGGGNLMWVHPDCWLMAHNTPKKSAR